MDSEDREASVGWGESFMPPTESYFSENMRFRRSIILVFWMFVAAGGDELELGFFNF